MKLAARILGPETRQRLHRTLTDWRAPKVSDPPPPDAHGRPVIAGLISTSSGIGESARLCAAALARLGFQPSAIDLSPRFGGAGGLESGLMLNDKPPSGAPLIIHLNPPELPYAAEFMGAAAMQGRLVIGYWAWELPEMPPEWRRGFRYVHEVWVPSTFCADAIRPWTRKPIHVVQHPLTPLPVNADRRRFGIPADRLAVLSICDLRSSLARKNLYGNIEAFRAAFGGSDRALLVIKLSGGAAAPDLQARLHADLQAADDIRLLDRVLSTEEMAMLYESVDVFLSLHRSEGFGLGIAETMMRGKVAVATDWSGNRDFLTAASGMPVPYRLVPVLDPQRIYRAPGQRWADADIQAAATALRQLADDDGLRQRLGAAARIAAARYFGDAAYATAISARFHDACGHAAGRPVR